MADPLPWHSLGPYFTVTVLEYTGDVPEHACPEVLDALRPSFPVTLCPNELVSEY